MSDFWSTAATIVVVVGIVGVASVSYWAGSINGEARAWKEYLDRPAPTSFPVPEEGSATILNEADQRRLVEEVSSILQSAIPPVVKEARTTKGHDPNSWLYSGSLLPQKTVHGMPVDHELPLIRVVPVVQSEDLEPSAQADEI